MTAFGKGDRVRDVGPNTMTGIGTVTNPDMPLRSMGPGPWVMVAWPSGVHKPTHEKDLIRA